MVCTSIAISHSLHELQIQQLKQRSITVSDNHLKGFPLSEGMFVYILLFCYAYAMK